MEVEIFNQKNSKKISKQSLIFEIIDESINNEYNAYKISRQPYIKSDFIPYNIIPTVMKYHFNSAELIFSYNENHGIYKILIKDLLIDSVINWEHNRPPDEIRCQDIARYIYNSRKPIDTMIYLSFNNPKEVFEVIDGIHRITALKFIKQENSKPLDLLNDCEFGSGNDASWLYNQYIVVNIRFNTIKGDLIETFQTFNKSIPVSELYICDHSKEKKDMIENIINEWCFKYKKHFSSSNNPVIGNTTRSRFENLLVYLYEKHKIRQSNCDKLKRLLEDANIRVSQNIPSSASVVVRAKCKESGCYLFLYKNDKLEDFI